MSVAASAKRNTRSMKYVSLHHHSTYSFMDGFGSPAAHVERAAELGMPALALTEHGNVSSHVQLEKAATKAGIKPIFGLEAYTALGPAERRKFHMTILAADAQGYQNLMEIVGRSYREGFYQWPTVSGRMLADHHQGLLVTSGCSDSLLACSLLGGKSIASEDASWERAKRTALGFKRLLGDRYYLECQMFPELERTRTINEAYERLSLETGIPLVATADVHYPHPNDNEMQVILHAAGRGAGSVAAQEAGWEYSIRLTHPISDRSAFDRAVGSGLSKKAAVAALRATAEIASRCSVVLPKAERLRYPLDSATASGLDLIWKLLREGWAYRVKQGNSNMVTRREEYALRIKHEMEQIAGKDFVDYFLMTADIIVYAKEHGCAVGPGRGSSAASLVCYLLRITEVDPLQHPLMLFERFIAPDRDDIPDIDTDFDDERRPIIREYAVRKYGEDRVGNIANYTKYRGKSALKDVGRVFPKIPKYAIDTAAAMVIERSGGDSRADAGLLDTVEMFPAVKAIFDKYPDLWKATKLEGNYRGMSVHAAGLVITNRPIHEVCALYTRERVDKETKQKTQVTVVSVDKKDAAYLGLMKADFLGLSTMGMIRIALEYAGVTLEELYALPLDLPEVVEGFTRNDVIGIFQFEGRATRIINREVKPTDFGEIVDINGLSRPGPLFSGTTADYIDIKYGRKQRELLHPLWDRITESTKGQIIYQEQVLAALKEIGKIPVTRVGEIRRIISQKLGEAQFNESAGDFVKGAAQHGISEQSAMHMWGRLVTSATYSFVYAHSASYAIIGYWAMWLKLKYPVAFYTAALRKSDEEHWPALIKDASRHGVQVNGVDPGRSGRTWAPTGSGSIAAGWLQVKGIGGAKADAVLAYVADVKRASGNPDWAPAPVTMSDLINVNGIGPKIMAEIESVDQEDPFGLLKIERTLREVRNALRDGEIPLPPPTHNSEEILDAKPSARVVFIGLVRLKEYKDFIEDERARTGDDLEAIKARMRDPHLPTGCVLHCYDDADEDVYIRVHRTLYPRFKRDLEAIIPHQSVIVAVGKKSRNSFGASVYVDKLYYLSQETSNE
jgi:DNA polymerase-3 subunit alpha